MTSLSGGQAARVNLASLLLSCYDVFLLDEPTNDLDIAGLEILEGFVRGLRAGTVLVSHDRAFVERTVHRVLELDLAQQQVRLYGGGYLAYLEERQIAGDEGALETYPGTFLLVTHDRRMLEAVAVSRRIAVANGHVTEAC